MTRICPKCGEQMRQVRFEDQDWLEFSIRQIWERRAPWFWACTDECGMTVVGGDKREDKDG